MLFLPCTARLHKAGGLSCRLGKCDLAGTASSLKPSQLGSSTQQGRASLALSVVNVGKLSLVHKPHSQKGQNSPLLVSMSPEGMAVGAWLPLDSSDRAGKCHQSYLLGEEVV